MLVHSSVTQLFKQKISLKDSQSPKMHDSLLSSVVNNKRLIDKNNVSKQSLPWQVGI